ncbi:MAG TPA: hypothetical protein VMV56_12795 [Williamwhitmania sp.]|nr:hypothetical protein [Williamwhitmania sp.]
MYSTDLSRTYGAQEPLRILGLPTYGSYGASQLTTVQGNAELFVKLLLSIVYTC